MTNIKRHAGFGFGILNILMLFSIICVIQGCGEEPEDGITISDVAEINPELGKCLIASKPTPYISTIPWEDRLAKEVRQFTCDLLISDDSFVSLNGIELLTGLTRLALENINLRSIELKNYPELSSVYLSSLDGNIFDADLSNLSKLVRLKAFNVGDIAFPLNNTLKEITLSLAQRFGDQKDPQLDFSMLGLLESLTLDGSFETDSMQVVDLTRLAALRKLYLSGGFSEILLPKAGSLDTFRYIQRQGLNSTPLNIDLKGQDSLSSLTLFGRFQDISLPTSGSLKTFTYSSDKFMLNVEPLSIDLSKQDSLNQLTLSGYFQTLDFPSESVIENLSLDLVGDAPIMLNLASLQELKSISLVGDYGEIIFPSELSVTEMNLNLIKQFPKLINADFKSLKYLTIELTDFDQSYLDLNPYDIFNVEYLSLSGEKLMQIMLDDLQYLEKLKLEAKIEFIDLSGSPELSSIDFNTPDLTELIFSVDARLSKINISDSNLNSLDLSARNTFILGEVTLSKSNVAELEFPSCDRLYRLEIERSPTLERLDLSNCSNLTSLILGRNRLQSLDLTSARRLRFLEYYSPPTLVNVDLNALAELDMYIYKYPLVEDLNETLVPDLVLRKCIRAAAEEANAVFLAEIERLDCTGDDDQSHFDSLVEFATGSGEHENTRVFDASGLGLMKNLVYLNLTGNWISEVYLSGLDKLNTVILDNNIIQHLVVPARDIETLSVNENPLKSIGMSGVKNLFMNGGVEWLNTRDALNELFDISEMKALDGEYLTEKDFNDPVTLSSTTYFFENIITSREYKLQSTVVW